MLEERYLKHNTGKLSYRRIKPVTHHQVNLLPKDLRCNSGNLRQTRHRQTSLRSWRALHPLLKNKVKINVKMKMSGSFTLAARKWQKQTFIQKKRHLRACFNWPEKIVLHTRCVTYILFHVSAETQISKWLVEVEKTLFMADILTCHRRRSTGGIYNINDGCISFRLAWSRALVVCILPHWHGFQGHGASVNIIGHSCAFTALTSQNVCCEKGP